MNLKKIRIKYYVAILFGVILFWGLRGVVCQVSFYSLHNIKTEIKKEQDLQKVIAKEVVRFHVIANSDSKEDQELKLKVKDKVVADMQQKLKGASDLEEAKSIMREHLDDVETIAKEVIQEEGYEYEVAATLGKSMFPVKVYGDMAFPSGEYEALKVQIGKSEGKNWWCVMFPTLCFIDGTYSIVSEDAKEEMQKTLGEEDYKALLLENQDQVDFKWKLAEWWNDLK